MVVLDAMIRYGVSLPWSVELTAQWDRILAAGPLSLDDLSVVRVWASVIFIKLFLTFIVVSPSRMGRSGDGRTGFGRTPWCMLVSGFVLI